MVLSHWVLDLIVHRPDLPLIPDRFEVILGPPPPSVQTLAVMGFVAWLMPLWAWWADRHREARG